LKKSDEPIIIVEEFKQSVERLWAALSEVDLMKHWFFSNIPDFKAEPGFKTRFPVLSGERKFTHLWKILEVIPQQKLCYNWKYEEYAGDSNICFTISRLHEKTVVMIKIDILEDFEDGIPEFERESCIAGWNYFLGERLKKYVESNN